MRKYLYVLAVLCTASQAQAQIVGCGDIKYTNDIYQVGVQRSVGVQANTMRSISPCPLIVQTEAWVEGVGGASKNSGAYSSPVTFSIGVPNWDKRASFGKHWMIWAPNTYDLFAYSRAETDLIQPPIPDCSVWNDGGDYYIWNETEQRCVPQTGGSPILIDTARDGFKLTSAEDGVLFDLNGDGIPEQIAWTREGSDDSWLVMDRNGNGKIDSGAEMFGNHTLAMPGIKALNGFEALKFLEPGIHLQVNGANAAFAQLQLWNDTNHNGFSEPDELTPATNTIAAIGTSYQEKRKRDANGNEFRQKGALTWLDGAQGVIYDVWLRGEQ
jgi:hypothetical protein